MEQQLGFCTTSDGVTIAYATLGAGPPLVYVCGWPGHLAAEWERPHARELLEALAAGFTLIRYDMRGSGLSDRDVSDFSLAALVRDVEAVADHLGLQEMALLSLGLLAGPIAIRYAAAHPHRVSALVLSSAFVRGGDITTPERQEAMINYASSFGVPMNVGGADDVSFGVLEEAMQLQKVAASREVEVALLRQLFTADVGDTLDGLSMPVLILHGRDDSTIPFAAGRELARRLPQARFLPFEGSGWAPWVARELIIPETYRFLGRQPAPEAPRAPPPSGLVTVLFTDMEGSTTATQRLGDAAAQVLVRAHNTVVRGCLKTHGGSEIKHTGDGIMASFPSASRALECAVAIQRGMAEQNAGVGAEHAAPLRVRIGLNAGEPVAEEEDLFGTAVQLASRICDHAEPGQILVANVVRELAAGKGFLFAGVGEVALRGLEDPVRLYEVKWQE